MQTFTPAVLVVVVVVLSVALVLLARRAPAAPGSPAGSAVSAVSAELIGDVLRAAEPITIDGTIVRAMRDTDAPSVVATIDDVVIEEMGWPATTIARDYGVWVASGRLGHFAVVIDAGSGGVVGVVGLEPSHEPVVEGLLGLVHLGIWAGPTGRGAGHMSRAVPAIADLLARYRIALVAETAVGNHRSRRVLERARMEPVGERTVELPDGREVPSVIYLRSPA